MGTLAKLSKPTNREIKDVTSSVLFLTHKYKKNISKILKQLDHPNRVEILNLVKRRQFTITEIKKRVGLAYKNVFAHVKFLEDYGLIKTHKQHKKQGRIVLVSATNRTINQVKKEIENKLFNEFMRNMRNL